MTWFMSAEGPTLTALDFIAGDPQEFYCCLCILLHGGQFVAAGTGLSHLRERFSLAVWLADVTFMGSQDSRDFINAREHTVSPR